MSPTRRQAAGSGAFDLETAPHRRLNPLTDEWVLVSPRRAGRPWRGREEDRPPAGRPAHDPSCYLCPGNTRAGGERNPKYRHTYVFDNDFPALSGDGPAGRIEAEGLIVAEAEPGLCRVVCFSPRHDLSIPQMEIAGIRRVVDTWTAEHRELARLPWIRHVQIFENRGELMGCSNPHPHGQIWANGTVPNEAAKESASQDRHWRSKGTCLLCRYREIEEEASRRVVHKNGGFTAVVPFWAVWPFETLILSRRHARDLQDLSEEERDDLAGILKSLTSGYDRLFRTEFPYSMGVHQRPTDGEPHPGWHLHLHVYPPLLRSATVKKFMVGYEMLAGPQRDLTPEAAAERLRAIPRSFGTDSRDRRTSRIPAGAPEVRAGRARTRPRPKGRRRK